LHGLSAAFGAGADRHRCQANEITAVPKLLELLTLNGAIVTVDALNGQRTIALQIVDQRAITRWH
jgi:predicted transposase YbfD/YdcC